MLIATPGGTSLSGGHCMALMQLRGQKILTKDGEAEMNKEQLTDAAQAFEGSLMIMRKDKAGWVFGLGVHPNDAPNGILQSPLGTRFHCVLFRIDDDETIVIPEDVRKGKKAVAIAGEMCRQEGFQEFMGARHHRQWRDDPNWPKAGPNYEEELAAFMLRKEIGIDSRSELLENEDAREKFKQIINDYRGSGEHEEGRWGG
jgi:hypothetical protein